jgi:hypothetical protein
MLTTITRGKDDELISFTKQESYITHEFQQTEIPTLTDSLAAITASVKIMYSHKIAFPYILVKSMTCLNVGLLRICQVLPVCCKTEYRRVTANC